MKTNLVLLIVTLLCCITHLATAQCTLSDMEIPDTLVIGDSTNQTEALHVEARNIKEIKLLVYSRMGKKIFESSSSLISADATTFKRFDTGWDGRLEGERLREGLYVYMLEGQCADRSTIRKSGTIILINQLVH
ncbi:MAG: gliding motility-associated C-terminal domain-containing protein [Aureispira sp.]